MFKNEWDRAPDWAKFLFAIGTIFAIVKWFPIVELLQLFFYVVIIPLGMLLAIGFVSNEAFETFCTTYKEVLVKLKEKQNDNPQSVQANAPQQTNDQESA